MAESVGAHIHIAQDEASTLAESNRKKQQAQQPRQLLSCTKCRERKVKVSHIHRFALQVAMCEMQTVSSRCALTAYWANVA